MYNALPKTNGPPKHCVYNIRVCRVCEPLNAIYFAFEMSTRAFSRTRERRVLCVRERASTRGRDSIRIIVCVKETNRSRTACVAEPVKILRAKYT